jgi:hypothetical protein
MERSGHLAHRSRYRIAGKDRDIDPLEPVGPERRRQLGLGNMQGAGGVVLPGQREQRGIGRLVGVRAGLMHLIE